MLQPSDIFDVIKRVGSVTKMTLVDFTMLLTGDHAVHHYEVLHVVAGRSLMALGAVLRCHRRMNVARDLPRGSFVARRAVLSE